LYADTLIGGEMKKPKTPQEQLPPSRPDKPIVTADAQALEKGLVQIPPIILVEHLERDSNDPTELKLNIPMAPPNLTRDIRS
jgi:hypothetical protein